LDRGEHYDYALFCCQIPEDYAKEGEFILRLLQKGYIKLEVTDRGREVLGEFDD
jgi:hypothetical protein